MIVFETVGLIDMRAFTTMGLSAKPNTASPIGYFGTGLKYAMAVLVRLGAQPVVQVGLDTYRFEKKEADFRGVKYDQLRMRCRKSTWRRDKLVDLPFTTQYGRNWEAWQVFRELEANTRDEKGSTFETDTPVQPQAGVTSIVVDLSPFTDAYHNRDTIFLPEADGAADGVQYLPRESEHLFWRGLRVYKTDKPSLYTYNFGCYLTLTEDRTLAYEFTAKAALAEYIIKCDDETFIEKVITCGEDFWEYKLDFPNGKSPSRAFYNVMLRQPRGLNPFVGSYWDSVKPDKAKPPRKFNLMEEHPLPWAYNNDDDAVYDKDGCAVFERPAGYRGTWQPVAESIIHRVNYQDGDKTPWADEQPLDESPQADSDIYPAEPPPAPGLSPADIEASLAEPAPLAPGDTLPWEDVDESTLAEG